MLFWEKKKKIQQAPVNSRGAEPNECGKWDVCMFINYLLSFKKSTYLFLNPRHFPESIFFCRGGCNVLLYVVVFVVKAERVNK